MADGLNFEKNSHGILIRCPYGCVSECVCVCMRARVCVSLQKDTRKHIIKLFFQRYWHSFNYIPLSIQIPNASEYITFDILLKLLFHCLLMANM